MEWVRSREESHSVDFSISESYNFCIKMVKMNRKKRYKTSSGFIPLILANCSETDCKLRYMSWKWSEMFMPQKLGMKQHLKIFTKLLIWKDFSSRKMRKKRWKLSISSLNWIKETKSWQMEAKSNQLPWASMKRKNFSRYSIVFSAVLEWKNALAENYLLLKHLTWVSRQKDILTQ